MNVADCIAICRDFVPIRTPEGKVQCRSLIGGETCSLPTHFRCELLIHKDRAEVDAHKRLPMISVSRVNLLEECPRKFALTYIHKATAPVPQEWKVVGSNFAIARAKIDSGQDWSVPDDPDPYAAAKLRAILKRYLKEPRPAVDNEIEVRVTVRSARQEYEVRGFLDAISKDRKHIVEWKYAAREYDRLKIARQASIYFACVPETETLLLARAKKPNHRPADGESPQSFEARIERSLLEKSPFEYKVYLREEFDVDGELRRLVEMYEMASEFEQIGFPPKYSSCEMCDYKRYCIEHVAKGIGCSDPKCSHPAICGKVRG